MLHTEQFYIDCMWKKGEKWNVKELKRIWPSCDIMSWLGYAWQHEACTVLCLENLEFQNACLNAAGDYLQHLQFLHQYVYIHQSECHNLQYNETMYVGNCKWSEVCLMTPYTRCRLIFIWTTKHAEQPRKGYPARFFLQDARWNVLSKYQYPNGFYGWIQNSRREWIPSKNKKKILSVTKLLFSWFLIDLFNSKIKWEISLYFRSSVLPFPQH